MSFMVTRFPPERSTDSRISISTTETDSFPLDNCLTFFTFPTTKRPDGNMAAGLGMKSSLSSFSITRPSTERERRMKHPFLVVETTYACAISPVSGSGSASKLLSPSEVRDSRRLSSTAPFLDLIAAMFPRTRHFTYFPSG